MRILPLFSVCETMMIPARPLQQFSRLSSERRRLLLRALFVLTAVSAAVALLPFRRAIRLGSLPLGRGRPASPDEFAWAVEAAARRLPWRTMCIEKGLAVQRMLRAAGVDAALRYGARHLPGSGELKAHVWVMVGGKAVIGGEEAADFAPVATYP